MSVFENLMQLPTPVTQVFDPLFDEKKVKVWVKRDDLTHEHISGNKYRKLKFNVKYAFDQGINKIMTFGGAYSNHIAAFAETCKVLNITGKALIRGDELNPESNDTLHKAQNSGIELVFVSRNDYRDKEKLISIYGKGYHIIPEGGSNLFALKGVAELIDEQPHPDFLVTAMGTGGTYAGLAFNKHFKGKIIGIPVLKNAIFLEKDIQNLLGYYDSAKMKIIYDYHFGGYGKFNSELIEFIQNFENKHHIPLEQVYTGKMAFAVYDLISKGFFPEFSKIMILHTGGLQGKIKKN